MNTENWKHYILPLGGGDGAVHVPMVHIWVLAFKEQFQLISWKDMIIFQINLCIHQNVYTKIWFNTKKNIRDQSHLWLQMYIF